MKQILFLILKCSMILYMIYTLIFLLLEIVSMPHGSLLFQFIELRNYCSAFYVRGSSECCCSNTIIQWKRRYQMLCTRPVSGITFIRYTHNQKIGKSNKLKFWSNKTKGLNRIYKLDLYVYHLKLPFIWHFKIQLQFLQEVWYLLSCTDSWTFWSNGYITIGRFTRRWQCCKLSQIFNVFINTVQWWSWSLKK